MPNAAHNPGLFLAFGSAMGYSCFNIGVRFFVGELSIWGMLFVRGLIGVGAVWLLARHFKKRLWGRNWLLLAGIGICGFMATVCTTTAISRIPLYQAMVLLYLYPALSILLAVPLNREALRLADAGLVLTALAGSVILIWPDEAAGLSLGRGHLIGFGGSLLFSLSSVLTRRLGESNSGLEPIFHYSFYAALCVPPLSKLFGAELGLYGIRNIGAALGLGCLGTLAQLMGYAALRWLPAGLVGVIGTLEIVGATFASWLIFSDPMTGRALFGAALIILAAFSLSRMPGNPAPAGGG
jgi:drug/metabolite transporter (DMT)-like permease